MFFESFSRFIKDCFVAAHYIKGRIVSIEHIKERIKTFPDSPGVYVMKDVSGNIIYIGKATSLKKRVSSYFCRALGDKTEKLVGEIYHIGFTKTANVLEALILEANLISKYKPLYNIKLKDDKSFVNIIITKEAYPRIYVLRPTEMEKISPKYIFGPYLSKQDAIRVVNYLVRIFGERGRGNDTENIYREYYLKGYASGKIGSISKKDYRKIIKNIRMFLEGKKEKILKTLRREMEGESKKMNYEKAAQLRNRIYSLKHIRDVAFIKKEDVLVEPFISCPHRVEAYDISNISGSFSVGGMAVFTDGLPDKNEYRKFKIKHTTGANDVAMIQEIVERRFAHAEWTLPDLIVIDGGITQKNAAELALRRYDLKIPIVAIAKGPTRKGEKLFFTQKRGFIYPDVNFIKKIRDEAHRFAVHYHRHLRKMNIRKK